MKQFILGAVIVLSALNVSAAATTKICFFIDDGLGNGIRGDRFIAQITTTKLRVINHKDNSGSSWEGDYKTTGRSTVIGKDGKTYLAFPTNGEEGCNTILVDKNLTTASGTGQIKFQCRGEGFMVNKFFCRNDER